MTPFIRLLAGLFVMLWMASLAYAHPADELCGPGSELDRELCRALSEIDSAGAQPTITSGAPEKASAYTFERKMIDTLAIYIRIGFEHILPGGADHILFVLAIVLTVQKWRPLVVQLSAFTLAHSVTLGLTAAGMISPPPAIIEPLIAATIAFVAIENLFVRGLTRWRPFVVFGFGLVHGMGFAGAFGELGLPQGVFWSALVGFNVGVEIGQLCVVAIALGAMAMLARALPVTADVAGRQNLLIRPLSLMIGLVGLFWFFTRL